MKKCILFISFVIGGLSAANAQTLMGGPEVGLNISTISQQVNGSKRSNEMLPGLKIGGVLDIGATSHFSIQPGLYFSMKGYKNDYTRTVVLNKLTYTEYYNETIMLNYLEIPINFLYKSGLYSGGRFFVGGGPYVAVATNGKIKTELTRELQSGGDGSSVKETKEHNLDIGTNVAHDDIRPADAGLNLTGGYEFRSGLFVRGNAALGLANIQPSGNANTSMRNMTIGVSVGYLFGK
jgi:hypothetical protein